MTVKLLILAVALASLGGLIYAAASLWAVHQALVRVIEAIERSRLDRGD